MGRFLCLTAFALALSTAAAETPRFTLAQITSYPFVEELVASPADAAIAWTMVERGVRSVWTAEGSGWTPRQLFSSREDDGQELTGLRFAGDGKWIVYVRGGDHHSNWTSPLPPNPTSSAVEPKVQIWAVKTAGGDPIAIAEGDDPIPAPRGLRVAFQRDRQIWIVPIDGSQPSTRLFFARGASESPVWSPDGSKLAFVSDRGEQSYIAVYESDAQPIRYLAPSTTRDSEPRWSPDGKRIAFVRRAGRGGPARPPLERPIAPWAIWVADVATGEAREIWKSPDTLRGSYPRLGASLDWADGDRIVFRAELDNWPHMYAITMGSGDRVPGSGPVLLTPGNFTVEFVGLTPDRKALVYNANTGPDRDDIERRHVFRVPVDAPNPVQLTKGLGSEWAPVVAKDGTLAFVAADARRPPVVHVGERALTADRIPRDFPASQLVVPEHVTFRAPDGVEIHGQLFKPSSAGRHPAVVYVHGGPARQMLLGWHYRGYYANAYAVNQYLASRGFLVLSVNYRLGIGYGQDFQQPERGGARGASEYQDVLAAGRWLQARPDVDAARIGIWGGSYGGYLTALALGRNSDVFAAGVDIHGVHNRASEPSEELRVAAAVGDGVTTAQLAEAARVAWQSSPVSAVDSWRSPVLLIHADDDRNVRFSQTVDLAERLKARGIPIEEIVIPDDIHGFLLHRNWHRVNEATVAFFEKHLGADRRRSRSSP